MAELNQLLEVADQVWEALSTSNVSTISKPSTSNLTRNDASKTDADKRYERLENEISELKSMISSMASNRSRQARRNPSRDRNSFRRRSSSRKRFSSKGRLCYYHFKFGDQAYKCTLPCERNGSIAPNKFSQSDPINGEGSGSSTTNNSSQNKFSN